MKQDTTVIIGAGPFGLAAATHMKAKGISPLIVGKPMEFWRNMPPHMYLKSSWGAITISDPANKYTVDAYCKLHNIPKQGLVPISFFLDYSRWFQQQAVPEVDETYVKLLAQDGKLFRVELEDGRSIQAERVLVATGLGPFATIPEFAAHLPSTLASHTQHVTDYSAFKGKSVVVVGSGQSAFESASFLCDAGATKVEVIARGPITWISRRLYRSGPAKHLFYAPSDIGPAGISWLVAFPMLFKQFPEKMRIKMDTRSVRPAVADWLRHITEKVTITPNTKIVNTEAQAQDVCLKLSDGTTREVDHIILATGYKSDIRKLNYIDPSLCQHVQQRDGYPFLNKWFESSVPHLYFAGSLSGYDFGPLCRHIIGTGASAVRITRHTIEGL